MTTSVPLARGMIVFWSTSTGAFKITSAIVNAGLLECTGGKSWSEHSYAASSTVISTVIPSTAGVVGGSLGVYEKVCGPGDVKLTIRSWNDN